MKLHSLLDSTDLRGKRVLVRLDVNVPLRNGRVHDDYRIRAALPTIRFLIKQKAVVILVGHLGRPPGFFEKRWSLRPVARLLEKYTRRQITLINQYAYPTKTRWSTVRKSVASMSAGSILMLENIRCSSGEDDPKSSLAHALAACADVFVMDGFGVAHRSAASVNGVARLLPSYAGLLLEREVSVLSQALKKPQRPCVVVLGGAKVETKIPVLRQVIGQADAILLGGEMLSAYRASFGLDNGLSHIDPKLGRELRSLLRKGNVVLPCDAVVGTAHGKRVRMVQDVTGDLGLRKDEGIFDIGPQTIELFERVLAGAQTIIWNGSMGKFEEAPYRTGTKQVVQALKNAARQGAEVIVGGGETVEVVRAYRAASSCSLVSTGGGAMLAFLGGQRLPGVVAVSKS